MGHAGDALSRALDRVTRPLTSRVDRCLACEGACHSIQARPQAGRTGVALRCAPFLRASCDSVTSGPPPFTCSAL